VSEADRERRERVRAALAEAGPAGVSGPGLAELLGCSRAAVHRHVEALRREGLRVEAGPGGYRLAGAPDLVVPALVEPRLAPPLAGPVVWLAETGSTNDDVVRRAREGAAEGLVVGADHQTAGRGRRGRVWVARPGDALLVSVLLRPPVAPVEAGLLPIVVAVAAADALAAGRAGVTIAWPNDVMVGGRKVAGILCELSGDQDRVAWAVAGVGVNVRAAPRVPDARWPPGALADSGPPPSRADLLVALLAALGARYERWLERGPEDVVAAFCARDGLLGREVRLSVGDQAASGEARGIDELGRLRLRTPEGVRLMAAGEVTGVDA
jgi:BirA family transcriptional regulator, biotin operon repressor / biotin---[acetyl-CoA-carboxylase] ligase